ncbi:MAG: 30S ribosomal protein S12 methylthiotransferase RimO [Magnetococcales bacterium]|nr:30S ribosomal protein S12 methylthiotransferase RimO [Magnetococcales bacterium]NGZ25329.1 30S ribosomal protein S12 methylthiotransferase RimO [Magnetococcales bacterium]
MGGGKRGGRMVQHRTVGVISLGCPKNLVDTEYMLGHFVRHGYQVTPSPQDADVLVVNTCGFLAEAEQESREAILEMAAIKAAHPGKQLVVTGCLAQRQGAALAQEIPGIDLLTGVEQYHQILPLLDERSGDKKGKKAKTIINIAPAGESVQPPGQRLLATLPHVAYLKIAEGCSNTCAFCVIPSIRGPYRSRPAEDIVSEAAELARRGVRELVVISQDTTLYGRDLQPRESLASLLRALDKTPKLSWIRLLYLYPTLVTDELLQTIAESEKILPYLDIPLQHADSAVLTRMRRAERADSLKKLVERIRHHLPESVLRSTYIVGFPGESEEEFENLLQFVAESRFDHVGVFTYSDEAGTIAHGMADKVPPQVAEERRHRLMTLQQEISREKLQQWRGQVVPVLVDGVNPEGGLLGRTWGQAPEVDGVVKLPAMRIKAGEMIPVEITDSQDYDLTGKLAM